VRGIWDDIEIGQVLLALHEVALQSGASGDFQAGFEAALASTALAFGFDLETTQLHTPAYTSRSVRSVIPAMPALLGVGESEQEDG